MHTVSGSNGEQVILDRNGQISLMIYMKSFTAISCILNTMRLHFGVLIVFDKEAVYS